MKKEDSSEIDRVLEEVRERCRHKEYSEALEAARTLLGSERTDDEQAEGLSMHAYIYALQNKDDEALAYEYQAHAKNPAHRGIAHSLLRKLIECGHYVEAIESADRLILLDADTEWRPFTDSAHFHKAYALYKLGRLEEAIQEFSLVEDEGNSWIDGRIVTKALLLSEIARARDLKR